MPTYYWDADKDALLRRTRGISFTQVAHSIQQGGLLSDALHPNQQRHPGQRLLTVNIDNYAYQVPYYRTENGDWLVTAYPSRRATRDYLRPQEDV